MRRLALARAQAGAQHGALEARAGPDLGHQDLIGGLKVPHGVAALHRQTRDQAHARRATAACGAGWSQTSMDGYFSKYSFENITSCIISEKTRNVSLVPQTVPEQITR